MAIKPRTPAMTRRRSSTSSLSSRKAKRNYVEHNYRDHYNDPIYVPGESEDEETDVPKRRGPRGGVVVPFPERLYNMLQEAESNEFETIVSWQPHGRCFLIHDPKKFVDKVMPMYFRQSKLTSFQRQVNLYGFVRLTAGKDRGAYYHELFLRGRPDLYKRLVRIRVKGTGIKSASSPATEPDFYSFPRCVDNGPKAESSKPGTTMETEVIMPMAEPISSSQFDYMEEAVPAKPIWKPLSAPPKMVVVSPELGPIDDQTLVGKSIEETWKLPTSTSLSLSSMAKGIVCISSSLPACSRQEDACPVTPDSTPALRQIVSNELEEALAMVSPVESPVPSPFPSMANLADVPALVQQQPESLGCGLDPAPTDFKLDACHEGIRALLESEVSDFPELTNGGAGLHSDDSLDPLFLLDEVTCTGH